MGERSLLDSLAWRPEQGNLVMVLDREGDEPPLLLDAASCYLWHSVSAHDMGREIIADFIGYDNRDNFVGRNPVASAVMKGRQGDFFYPGALRSYVIDPAARRIREDKLDDGKYEWPRINERHRCHDYRIAYLLKTRPGDFFWTMLRRVDMARPYRYLRFRPRVLPY